MGTGHVYGPGERYLSPVHKYSPNARTVADRFHVIRLINQHFLACWRDHTAESLYHSLCVHSRGGVVNHRLAPRTLLEIEGVKHSNCRGDFETDRCSGLVRP
jgi:hypothetical protein